MSWVHHKPPAPPLSATTSANLSSNPIQTPLNINASFMPPPNSNLQKQKQVPPQQSLRPQIATSNNTNNSSPLLMTSQYPNKSSLSTNTAMRLNSNAAVAYPSQQQQVQRQQQQQQPQAHLHGTSQPPPPSALNNNNNGNHNPTHIQGVFNNQQNTWQNHPGPTQNYLPSSKMMPQTQLPAAAAATNNWQHQQQQQQQPQHQQQQNYTNSNMLYQQNPTSTPPQQQWAQQQNTSVPPQQGTAVATYDNFFNHQANNNMYQQQQPPTSSANAAYYQQPPPPAPTAAAAVPSHSMSQTNAVNFFDNTTNNNNNQSTDGWGDWDWNDNSTTETSAPSNEIPTQQQQLTAPTPAHPQQTSQVQQSQPTHTQPQPPVANDQVGQQSNLVYNSSIIADSFNQQSNDTWNWNNNTSAENEQHVENRNATNNAEQHNDNWNWGGSNDSETSTQQQNAVSVANDHAANDSWNWQTNENQQKIAVSSSNVSEIQQPPPAPSQQQQQQQHGVQPPVNVSHIKAPSTQTVASAPVPPPPTEFSSSSVSENHNYNTNAATAPGSTNIPNTVFVSQAKPVTLPSRQYASPPMGNTPITENPPESALMPPQAFQNIEEATSNRPPNVLSPPLGPPPAAATPPNAAALPPPSGLPAAAASGNPFKRSGVAQHHRATGLMNTAPAAVAPTVFNMPPPPPADFANPLGTPAALSALEPENNELPSQENQEILSPPVQQIPQAPSSSISLPNSAAPATASLPPPNDERNQYLQTSHLSENSEEQQPEADGLLPPPGLSRLVLGEPELEASQRMVMGTDAPVADNTAAVGDVMHLEERHADGEDTASENAVPVISVGGQGVLPSSSSMSSDRNLYLVPGESNASNNQQRVVTGVELQEQREIEMDGENLEDQQQQQQQQQQLQQHNQQQQQLQQHQTLSPEARNEPPVEGADENIVGQQSLATTQGQPSVEASDAGHHQASKTKDPHSVSSPNDDEDSDERLLNDRGMNQSTAGSSKSRSKYDGDRQPSSRRRDKRSMNRYESDEYMNSEEGEYSSDREERERRERNNDRRRNYREGSVRSDRGAADEDDKRNRRQNRDKRDKYYYEGEERSRGGDRLKSDSRRSQRHRGYENDSRYETEESTRFDSRKDASRRSMRHPDAERNRRSDRSDQGADYDDYNRRGAGYRSSKRSGENYEGDRRERRRGGDDYDTTLERRRRSDKHRDARYRDDPRYDPRYDPREYEEYRKHSSRNARDSDLEKEGGIAGPPRSGRMHHDPRHASAMYGYPAAGGYYDPYTAYYYQQMARTNPQAYAEWYKKYYGQHAAAATAAGLPQGMPGMPTAGEAALTTATNDGRESVHSGRSSAHNDLKDRYTHAYITQANEYHRHYHQHHHQQHQQQLQHHHHQQMAAFNQTLNSTLLDEDSLNQSISLYSGLGGGLTAAHSQTNLSQIHGGVGGGYYVPPSGLTAAVHTSSSAAAAAAMYYARSDYAESRSGAVSVRDPDPIATEPQRLTPCKFINEHTVVSFGSGVLVTVKPKYTPHGNICNIVKLLKFKPNDETRKLFKVFPGPLVRGLTHKKTVIEFCQEQIRLGPMETTIYAKQLISNNSEKYRGSYTLMWNLLILLLKQNGMVVGTDIAELLLKNQQQFPYQTPASSINNSLKSKSGSEDDLEAVAQKDNDVDNNDNEKSTTDDKEEKTSEKDAEENGDNSLTKSTGSSSLSENDITEKFRNYLLYGNVNEALEWATDNNLWGHALFLASKLDRRSHANVMMKFANKLALNDPLQTLYQLMSGRSPSSVTCVQDEKWGDWRPHLSMILSNTSQKPELDRKAITTLGDSLFNRGDLYAAHFCYLMAQVSFGRYQESATQETSLQQHLPKLILLGSSHYKQFHEFAHNEAIIMTEIYEYACSLNDEKFSIVEFQPYKFLLASRLLDYGFHLKSLMYLEQISVHISRDATKYESSFINKVYEMADRLKYYDPVLEKTIDDQQQTNDEDGSHGLNATQQQMEEQKWLQNLRQMAQQYKIDYGTNTTTLAPSMDGQQTQQVDPNYNYQQQQIDQQFMEINKQFSELNLQYQSNQEPQQQQQPTFYNPDLMQQQPPLLTTDPQPTQPMSLDSYQSQAPDLASMPAVNDLQQQHQHQQPLDMSQAPLSDASSQQQQLSYMQPADVQQQPQSYGQNYYDPSQQQPLYGNDGNSLDNQTAANSYDYWSQQQQQPTSGYGEENARPTISMPKTKSYDTDDEGGNNSKQQAGQKSSAAANDNKKGGSQQQQQQQKNKETKDAKGTANANQNSGWFGGIWNKFSLKPKNQMILPDDKNPSIVWDADKKKWVNTDGDDQAEESFKPPPKMGDLMSQSLGGGGGGGGAPTPQIPNPGNPQTSTQMPFMDPQQQQQQQYVPTSIPNSAPSPNPMQQQPQTTSVAANNANVPAPAKTPTLQSNMFKMQRNRTLKNAYVDVFNPSGAPVNKAAENILAPALPPAAVPQSGFFIPGGTGSTAGGGSHDNSGYQQQQPQDTPQFYNPNQFGTGSGY